LHKDWRRLMRFLAFIGALAIIAAFWRGDLLLRRLLQRRRKRRQSSRHGLGVVECPRGVGRGARNRNPARQPRRSRNHESRRARLRDNQLRQLSRRAAGAWTAFSLNTAKTTCL
jgi:hypothetical protein